ncbi:nitrite reductase large subunit NirB [Streptomyces sp. SID11385]|uniref:nitrite reductase large subunit NirB n=1 Tax=Streptomyces sp. SID11385 TaxID=2706031 RepID=UPI0013C6E873|nr:nitrite reductase large subunit NirB [Streptomyces sp. SID11385]NEA43725.1 nitrite reductase large subunit [Streptomyces sp. SID11385]
MTATPAPRELVLVGHGMVGQRFLEALVAQPGAAAWHVTVLAEEPRPAYDRVHLSSWFTGTTAEELSLVPPDFVERHGITLHLGDPATAIDRAARTVTTASGRRLPYDALVLATGSAPFVPPVPGKDLPGCHVYRTIEDLQAIRADAERADAGVVVGGGLLGLEAAGALVALGVETHVVEFAPRLMALQIDDGGGQLLREKIEELGVVVHTGVGTSAVRAGEDGRAARAVLSDDSELPAGLVVFAAGVRPRDQLARACGLPVGERGGVVVDEACRTEDPHVWAIGECARTADGRVYGLVAPGYAMAEAAASRLCGGEGAFTGADLSTKLKLLGVDVAGFGDPHGTADGVREVTFSDSRSGVYKKLLVGPDGALTGGVLVGDTEEYGTLRALTLAATPLTVPPASLVLPASARGGGPAPELPDAAVVCSCHHVSAGAIRTAVREQGCADVAAVKKCTKAGTGCGSCTGALTTLVRGELAAGGEPAPSGLCEHFPQTRAELYEIIRVTGTASFAALLAAHGSGEGCEICKPVVASILASLDGGHLLDGEQAALQDTNDHHLANIQRNGSYSVVPRVPGGEITPAQLIVLGEVARDFGLYTKITGGQRIDLLGARVDQLPAVWQRLVDAGFESGHAYGKALRTVKSCVGETWCRYGVQDSTALAIALELRYRGLRAPHKLKSAVSGCARECAEARGKDFGIIATSNGWNLYVGGNGGTTPRHADLLATDLDTTALIRVIDRFLMFYIRTADRLERTSAWLERLEGGLDHLRAVVMDDSLGIAADLDALMERHVAHHTDEWAAVLADPERLRRFASFANAPGTPDPTVTFVPERGQIRPARPGEPGTLLDTPATSRVLIPLPAVPAAPRAQEAHR